MAINVLKLNNKVIITNENDIWDRLQILFHFK